MRPAVTERGKPWRRQEPRSRARGRAPASRTCFTALQEYNQHNAVYSPATASAAAAFAAALAALPTGAFADAVALAPALTIETQLQTEGEAEGAVANVGATELARRHLALGGEAAEDLFDRLLAVRRALAPRQVGLQLLEREAAIAVAVDRRERLVRLVVDGRPLALAQVPIPGIERSGVLPPNALRSSSRDIMPRPPSASIRSNSASTESSS